MKSKLKEALSRWGEDLDLSVSEINLLREFEGGSANRSFLIALQARKVVVRLWQELSGSLPRSWEAERYAAGLAEATALSPNILFECNDPKAIFMEYGGAPKKGRLSAREIEVLSGALARLHAIKFDTQKLPRQNYIGLIEDYFGMVESDSVRKNLKPNVDELKALANDFTRQFSPCFTHHDLARENILWQDGDVVFVDWEYACAGNPAFDLATVANSFELELPEIQMFREAYQSSGGASFPSQEEYVKMRRFVSLLSRLWYAAVFGQLESTKCTLGQG